MPFPTSTILFSLWFSLACFVLSPHKLLLRVSVNSFQVLASRHPTVPARLPPSSPQAAPAPPARGQHPGALKTAAWSQPGKNPSCTSPWVAALRLLGLLVHAEVCVQTRPFPRGLQSPSGFAYSPRAARTVSLLHGEAQRWGQCGRSMGTFLRNSSNGRTPNGLQNRAGDAGR